ncbi:MULTISPECIES: FeoA family protein [Geobacillus]|uniref:Ferrous iron transporter FeoA-like domain-containing protein n=2 Tax=Geobacillus thermoleovorans group TaxID=1505648 RepID=U2WUI8_GEOKU|nr:MULTISPECIES: FeoA family protein [Geobacillus thermoleovorans group]QOR82901.1 ferrous iron transport protein A [Geobacillus stearothermophilus]AUI35265.1 ferrous iron transport protein A [[Bacillus] caldolyticus]MED4972896.1 FeoA family protein [Geobacillus thermoleovorans]QCK83075.1 ferrous iron transport protein A [Geobacillus kaustophilus NBRC 102445]TLS34650.1 ferrous iron transport protein A [Geobacillus thermoleovorans]
MVLTDLHKGEAAVVVHLAVEQEALKQRLLHLGVKEGKMVRLKAAMPFGGPVMIEVDGQAIGLRRKEASSIEVK